MKKSCALLPGLRCPQPAPIIQISRLARESCAPRAGCP